MVEGFIFLAYVLGTAFGFYWGLARGQKQGIVDTIDNLNEIISPLAKWDEGFDGLIQLICIKMISEKLKENNE